MKDFKFRFSFSEYKPMKGNFNLFLKELLIDLMEFCDFYNGDQKLEITSFKLKHPGEKIVEIYDSIEDDISSKLVSQNLTEDEKSLFSTEPRIAFVIKLLKNVQRIVRLGSENNTYRINKIELRDAEQWLLMERNHPSVVYQHLAYTCNANCLFCYLKANPDNICIGKRNDNCTYDELMTRIKYFSGEKNLFSQSFEIKEFFNSPYFKETLLALREKTEDEFFFVTNGTLLTEEVVHFLSTIAPVTLIVSVIVTTNEMRSKIMFDNTNGEIDSLNKIALESFELMEKYNIPFIPSITAWPTISYNDFIATIQFLEKFDPVAIRVNMLGYTDKNKPSVDVPENFWYTFCSYIERATRETEIPILPIPSQYYINEFQEHVLDVCVLGTIKNSPARKVLKKGDKILKINGYRVTSRDQFLDALTIIKGEKKLLVEREGNMMEFVLPEIVNGEYPFLRNRYGKYFFPYGICIPESIQEKHIKYVIKEIEHIKEKNQNIEVMLIVGPLVKKSVIAYFERFGADYCKEIDGIYLDNCTIKILDAYNYYLGGNMKIMDMCVAADIIKIITENRTESTKAVFLPDSMFNIWGNDLMGMNKDIITKCVRLPILFISSKTMSF